MSFTLAASGTIALSGPTAVKFALFGDEITTADAFKTLAQGSASVAVTTIYTATAVMAVVKTMTFFNTAVTPSLIALYANGTAAANQIYAASIPAGGTATYGPNGWQVTDALGTVLSSSNPITATGDATGVQSGTNLPLVLATVNSNVGAFGAADSTLVVTADAKGRLSALAATLIAIAQSQVSGLTAALAAKVGTSRLINTTAPLTGGGDLSADRTLAISPATTAAAGSLSAIDKQKLDNAWIDVTANTIALITPAQSAAVNTANMATLLSGAPNGSTIFFPSGLYQFNGAWTYPGATAKMFIFKGVGSNRAGSPATTFTELRWTANVGGDIITLPGSGNGWYTEFHSLCFTSSATQSAGALINVNGNVGTNFRDCSFQSVATGQTWFDVLLGGGVGGGAANNSWNSAVIDNCSFQGFTNSAIRVNSSGSSLVVTGCVIQGQWGSTTQVAAACISAGWVGALQIIGCDVLGAVNNLLINPVAASSEVCASIHCTNTYFDFAFGSCMKVTGTGATVRCKFDTCTFTTSNAGTGFSAIELAGSFVYTVGGQDVAFVNCNVYNTFGTTGTTNGILITNAADVSFVNVKVAGWTNGYNVTPMASNKTNLQIIGGTIGPSGGYGANTVGLLIAAGAYKGLTIRANNCINNTTNMTLGAVTVLAGEGSLYAITENAGLNPRGNVGVVAVPASATVLSNVSGFRVIVMQRFTVVPTGWAINGVACVLPIATSVFTFTLEPGGTIQTTGGTYTWTWVGQ